MVKILDCTTRDGGHQTNWEFDKSFVVDLIDDLNKHKVDFYEIGYRNHKDTVGKGQFYKCFPEFLKQFQKYKQNLQIGIMTDTSRFSINDFPGADKDYLDFIRIATHPERIQETLDIAYKLNNLGYEIFVQLMEIPNVKDEEYQILEQWEHKNIIKSIYIADSYSTVKPDNLDIFFAKLRKIGYKNISFHAHNESGLALENTLKAMDLGAYSIDVSQNGLGGNLNFLEYLKSI